MYRDIMLAVTGTPADEAALAAAVAFARAQDARLLVAIALHLPLAATAYGLTPVAFEGSYTSLREDAQGRRQRLLQRLGHEDVAHEVVLTESELHAEQQLLALQARYADLVFVAAPGAAHPESARLHATFAALATGSGRPVVAVPREGGARMPPRRIVVGWSPTPEASRAVHDALPLLRGAEHVDVVLVEPVTGELAHGQEPGADIATHLARHGVRVEASIGTHARGTVGSHLLVSAREQDADLIVAGAYGHSRAREWAFGGTTRELLERSHAPVLFAH